MVKIMNKITTQLNGIDCCTCKDLVEEFNIPQPILSNIARSGEVDCYKINNKWFFFKTEKTISYLKSYLKEKNKSSGQLNGEEFKTNMLLLDEPLEIKEKETFEETITEEALMKKLVDSDNIYCKFEFLDYEIVENKESSFPDCILKLKLEYQFQSQGNIIYYYSFKDDVIPIEKKFLWKFINFFQSLDWDFEAYKQLNLQCLLNEGLHHTGILQLKKKDWSICCYDKNRNYLINDKQWLTVEETANEYNVSSSQIRTLCREKKIDAKKENEKNGRWLIHRTKNNIRRIKKIEHNREIINEQLHRNS